MDKKTYNRMWRWSLVSAAGIGLFWLIYWLIVGKVPVVSQIRWWQLPFDISRWWDMLIGPIGAIIFNFVYYKAKDKKDEPVFGLVTGLVFGLVFILAFNLGLGLIFDQSFFLGLSLGLGLIIGLKLALGFKSIASPSFGLGFILGLSLVFGLIFGLAFALAFSLILGLCSGLGLGLIFGPVTGIRWLTQKWPVISVWLTGN